MQTPKWRGGAVIAATLLVFASPAQAQMAPTSPPPAEEASGETSPKQELKKAKKKGLKKLKAKLKAALGGGLAKVSQKSWGRGGFGTSPSRDGRPTSISRERAARQQRAKS